jgi:hypothetical protein
MSMQIDVRHRAIRIVPPLIPGRPYEGPTAPDRAYEHLAAYHGVDKGTASDRLHSIKARAGLGPIDNVVIGRTGDVYEEFSGERVGSLTDPMA